VFAHQLVDIDLGGDRVILLQHADRGQLGVAATVNDA
jgi:hypothetical protein